MIECSTCRHSRVSVSDIESQGPLLKCHRYPPTVVVIDSMPVQVIPDATDTCGEYQP